MNIDKNTMILLKNMILNGNKKKALIYLKKHGLSIKDFGMLLHNENLIDDTQLKDEFEIDLKEKNKNEILEKLKNGQLSDDELKSYYNQKLLTVEDIKNYYDNYRELLDIKEENVKVSEKFNIYIPLPQNRVDVFFVGEPVVGKSVILGGLLTYVNRYKSFTTAKENPEGSTYADILITTTEKGNFIAGTNDEMFLNTSFDFYENNDDGSNKKKKALFTKKEKTKILPINFIETAGEHFEDIYGAKSKDDNTINENLKKFLFESKNKKIFIFTIEYGKEYIELKNKENNEIAYGLFVKNILSFFERNNLLNLTHGIAFVITKWDNNPNQNTNVESYFKENFNSILGEIQIYKNNGYKFGSKILPFSIGDVNNINKYKFNENYSKNLYEWLSETVPYREKN